jgi:hypothetical protein
MGGATARGGVHDSAFCSRDAAHSVLIVGIPGVEEHARSVLNALGTWVGRHRMPNFTFDAAEFPSAYDDWTLARLRRHPHLRPGGSHGRRAGAGVVIMVLLKYLPATD